jgi:K+-transporting ATPase ATPase A chain
MLNGWLQISAFLLLLVLLIRPLGSYMARVYLGQPHILTWLGPLEWGVLRLCGIRADREMEWKTYATSVLLFSAAGMAFIYLLQRLQGVLPLNPRHLGPLTPCSPSLP